MPNVSNEIKKTVKIEKEKVSDPAKKTNAFYDGRIFYNNTTSKTNLGSISKERTK